MKRFILLSALCCIVGLGANAQTVSGTYSVTQTQTAGQTGTTPSVNDDLSHPNGFTVSTPANTVTTAQPFITTDPAGSSGLACGRNKQPECTSANDTVYSTLTADFQIALTPGVYETVTDTGIYEANYTNNSDYIDWNGATDNSACTPYSDGTSPTVTDCVVLPATFADGDVVDVILNDAADWNITSDISFEYLPETTTTGGQLPVPEPTSIALLCVGILGLGAARWLRYRSHAMGCEAALT